MLKRLLTIALILGASSVYAGEDWLLGLELSLYGGLTAEHRVSERHRLSLNYLQFEGSYGTERRYGARWHFLSGEGPHKLEVTAAQQYVGKWEQYADAPSYEKTGPHLVVSVGYRFERAQSGWAGRLGVLFSGEAERIAVLIPWPYAAAGFSF